MMNVQVPSFLEKAAVYKSFCFVSKLKSQIMDAPTSETDSIHLFARIHMNQEMDMFRRVVKALTSFDGWSASDTWKEEVVYFYDREGKEVMCVSDNDSLKGVKLSSAACPERNKMVVPISQMEDIAAPGEPATRIEIVCERRCQCESGALYVLPKRVQIRYKRTFFLPFWKFTVVKYWENNTLVNVQQMVLQNTKPLHTVVVECIRLKPYLDKHHDNYVAVSLLLKISSVFLHQRRVQLK